MNRRVLRRALDVVVAGGLALVGVSGSLARVDAQPVTLAVVDRADSVDGFTLADGKLAWIPPQASCRAQVRVFDLTTSHTSAFGVCDDLYGPTDVAIAGAAV